MREKEQLDSIFAELNTEDKQKEKRIIILALCLCGMGAYLFFLIFGSNSFSVLKGLRQEKSELEKRVERLQIENVELQKTIFELKGLEPQNEE